MRLFLYVDRMYFVYILYSSKTDKYYTGSTDNLDDRLNHHNSGSTPSTKSGAPEWILKYIETLPDRTTALKRELQIKKKKSRIYIEWIIAQYQVGSASES